MTAGRQDRAHAGSIEGHRQHGQPPYRRAHGRAQSCHRDPNHEESQLTGVLLRRVLEAKKCWGWHFLGRAHDVKFDNHQMVKNCISLVKPHRHVSPVTKGAAEKSFALPFGLVRQCALRHAYA